MCASSLADAANVSGSNNQEYVTKQRERFLLSLLSLPIVPEDNFFATRDRLCQLAYICIILYCDSSMKSIAAVLGYCNIDIDFDHIV